MVKYAIANIIKIIANKLFVTGFMIKSRLQIFFT